MIWIGGTSGTETSWGEPDNWDTSAVPTSADDVYFTSASGYDCVASTPAVCKSVTAASGFTHNISFNGTTLTCVNGASFDHTGTLNLGNGLTITGDGDFHIGSGVGVTTVTSCTVDLQGTGNLDIDKGSLQFAKIKGAASGKTTTHTSAQDLSTTTLELGAGTWTNNRLLIVNLTTNNLTMNSSHTFNGTAGLSIIGYSAGTYTIPQINASGNTGWVALDNNDNLVTMNLDGSITSGGAFYVIKIGGAGNFTVNTNNNSITVTGIFYFASGNVSQSLYFNCGSSTIDIGRLDLNVTYGINDDVNVDLGTSTWYIAGDCDIAATTVITNQDTCTKWEFDGTVACTLTSAGKTLPTINVKKTGGGFTCTDSLTCYAFNIDAANNQSVSWSGLTLTCTMGATLDGTGSLNCGNGITCNGASSTFHVGSTLGTTTTSSCVVTLNGTTGMTLDFDRAGGYAFKQLVLGANAVVTNTSGAAFSFLCATGSPLVFTNGGTFTQNSANVLQFATNGASLDLVTISAGTPTLNGTGIIRFFPFGVTMTAYMPAITYSGSGSLHLGVHQAGILRLKGNLVATNLIMMPSYEQDGGIYYTDNYNITVSGNMTLGPKDTPNYANVTFYFGSSIVDVAGNVVVSTGGTKTATINLGTSTWYIAGDCDLTAYTTLNNADTCVGWTFDGTTAVGFTSSSKTLPALIIKKTGGGFTFSDAPSCQSLTIDAANNQAVSWNALVLTSVGSVNLGGSGTLNMGSGVTITGNGTFTVGASLGTITSSSCVLTLQGNDAIVLNKTLTVSRLLTKTQDKTITWTAAVGNKLVISSYTALDWGGVAEHLVTWVSSSPGTQYYIDIQVAIEVSYINVTDCNNVGTEIDADNGTNVNGGNLYGWLFTINILVSANSVSALISINLLNIYYDYTQGAGSVSAFFVNKDPNIYYDYIQGVDNVSAVFSNENPNVFYDYTNNLEVTSATFSIESTDIKYDYVYNTTPISLGISNKDVNLFISSNITVSAVDMDFSLKSPSIRYACNVGVDAVELVLDLKNADVTTQAIIGVSALNIDVNINEPLVKLYYVYNADVFDVNLNIKNVTILNDYVVNTSAIDATFSVKQPDFVVIVSATASSIDIVVSDYDKIKVRMFEDYANKKSMGNGTNMPNGWIRKCDSSYNNERKVMTSLLTEAYNKHGVCMEYYVTSYDTTYDKIFGEDNNRKFSRVFSIMTYYNLPREEKLWTKFGIDNMDQFSIFVSKLHFKQASTYGMSRVAGDTGKGTYSSYIPKVGDMVRAKYNNFFYEIVEVKEEIGMYLLSKQHVWELIVKPYKDEHIALSATTSAGLYEISAYTNQSADTLDISSYVSRVVTAVNYAPRSDEKESEDWSGGW